MSEVLTDAVPVLYSFRRCPYAMRARMALRYAGIRCELREVLLRDKPAEMLAASPKGTVPVLVLPGQVIDESLDVMLWALAQYDPDHWLEVDQSDAHHLIDTNDNDFKIWLDRYKYPGRHNLGEPHQGDDDPCDRINSRAEGERFLRLLEERLAAGGQLMGLQKSFVDIAIFPFVRQFAFVDIDWFENSEYQAVNRWLQDHLGASLFSEVMHKYPQWQADEAGVLF